MFGNPALQPQTTSYVADVTPCRHGSEKTWLGLLRPDGRSRRSSQDWCGTGQASQFSAEKPRRNVGTATVPWMNPEPTATGTDVLSLLGLNRLGRTAMRQCPKFCGIEVATVARLHPLLRATGFLVCAGCSGGEPAPSGAPTSGGGGSTSAVTGATAGPGVGGDPSSGDSAATSTEAVTVTGGGPTGGGGSASSTATGETPSAGGSVATSGGASSVPATGGRHEYVAVIPASALTAEDPVCGIQDFDRERKPAEVLLVIDRSGSMENEIETGVTRWAAIVPTVCAVIQATNSEIWWGVKSYPELDETEQCAPESIVPTIHVPIAENNAAAVVAEIEATTPLGDGTPTGDAIRFGLDHLLERATITDNPKYILLATDGEPNCPQDGTAEPLDHTVAQIDAALAAGFPTYVLGVDTTEDTAVSNLNEMAVAGGTPRPPSSVNPLAAEEPKFYLASTQAELEAAFRTITGEIGSCVFDLDPPPPVPDNIAVDFSGVRTERDPTRQNGWEYTTDDYTQLEVYGTWCDRIKTEASNQVNIKYGCPGVPIPLPG